jgi:trk system potassium uptake protein
MYIVIVGMGQVGRHVLRMLEAERHDIVAIDIDPIALEEVGDNHDVATLEGYGASQHILDTARAGSADLVVAVTNHDEVNLIAALAARRMGAKRSVARVQGNEWTGDNNDEGVRYGLLGVDVVFNPRVLLATEIAKIAQSHGALTVIDVANNQIEIVEMQLEEQRRMLHKPLAKLSFPRGVLVGGLIRDGEFRVPGGADVLLPGDRIYLVGLPDKVLEAEDLFSSRREARRIAVLGGGVIGVSVCRALKGKDVELILFERNRARAEKLAGQLADVTVIHGDGTNLALLQEEGIGGYDLFVAVSREDEVNLMAGLLAKRAGVPVVITLGHRPDYHDIYRQLGIDVVLSPRLVASDHVLRYCRQTTVTSLANIGDGLAQVVEHVTDASHRIVGVPVRRLAFPRGALLCAIIKNDLAIVPGGDDVVEAGDRVVVLTTEAARKAVSRLFQPRSV